MHSLTVWRIALDPPVNLDACLAVLDAEERTRAKRFRYAEHRRRFIVSHAAVRQILAQWLGQSAPSLRFIRNAYGKPQLDLANGPLFSLSHSHERALCVVANAAVIDEIGIDIEWQRSLAHADLARRFFSADEAAALDALPAAERQDAFFACWTRKEAYIKAKGLGLSLPLDAFAVTVAPHQAPALQSSRHDPADVGRYRFWEIPVPADYRAVLAYCGDAVTTPRVCDWMFCQ